MVSRDIIDIREFREINEIKDISEISAVSEISAISDDALGLGFVVSLSAYLTKGENYINRHSLLLLLFGCRRGDPSLRSG